MHQHEALLQFLRASLRHLSLGENAVIRQQPARG